MTNNHPVVLCHGFLGYGSDEALGFPYWGTALKVRSPLDRHVASVGPISSMHDRACELAFQIKGGRVDYGADHSERAGHDRFGKTREAFHPEWSEDRPVHLVGHSMGAPTIWLLQHLLEDDYFGWGSNARWVTSINSISGNLNGTTLVYLLGCDEQTGMVREGGVSDFLVRAVELHILLSGGLFEGFYDFDLDQWGISAEDATDLEAYLLRIARSPMLRGTDNAFYGNSVQGMCAQQARCRTHPEVYYFSYVTEQTFRGPLTGEYYPEPGMNPLLVATARYIGHATFDHQFYPGFHSSDWWPNDGVVPAFSQAYPRVSDAHPVGGPIDDQSGFEPGRWYQETESDVDHLDIVLSPELGLIGYQKRFYVRLFERLASL